MIRSTRMFEGKFQPLRVICPPAEGADMKPLEHLTLIALAFVSDLAVVPPCLLTQESCRDAANVMQRYRVADHFPMRVISDVIVPFDGLKRVVQPSFDSAPELLGRD